MKNITRLIGVGYLVLVLIATGASTALGSIGYAPFPVQIGPAPEPVVVTIWYSTEKEAWLKEAAARFAATSPRQGRRPIQIVLKSLGSGEIVQRIAAQDWRGDARPTVISPASSLWVELLRSQWSARGNPGAILGESAPPLALTPLVLVSWDERSRLLWPNDQADLWRSLHDALADDAGWPAVVQRAGFAADSPEAQRAQSWGTVKLGHTSPLTSNSGTQFLLLMAYAFHGKSSGLTVQDIQQESFATWMREIERAVPKFGDSTGAFMDELVRFGPSTYDVVATYENLAISSIDASQRWGTMRVYYPPATSFSDHPYAAIAAPWVTAEERAAADQFRDFLLSRPTQELALTYGFRPADPGVPISGSDPSNPFQKYAANGVRVDIGAQVATPDGAVISALLDLWRQQINR